MARTYERNGTKYVSSAWHNIERALLEKEISRISDGNIFPVNLSDGNTLLGRFTDDLEPQIQMGLNWCGIGEDSAEHAEKFAEALMKASKLVREYKYNGYVVDYNKTFDRLPVSEQEEIRAIVKANQS